MKHLNNSTLNLYLDDALQTVPRAEADAHLASCSNCARELAALRAVTASFDAWQAEPIPQDISVRVIHRVAQRPVPANVSRWGALLLGAQVLVVVGLFIWLLPTLSRIFTALTNLSLPSVTWNLLPVFDVLTGPPAVALPSLGVGVWGLLLLGGAVVWLVADRLIFNSLKNTSEASQ